MPAALRALRLVTKSFRIVPNFLGGGGGCSFTRLDRNPSAFWTTAEGRSPRARARLSSSTDTGTTKMNRNATTNTRGEYSFRSPRLSLTKRANDRDTESARRSPLRRSRFGILSLIDFCTALLALDNILRISRPPTSTVRCSPGLMPFVPSEADPTMAALEIGRLRLWLLPLVFFAGRRRFFDFDCAEALRLRLCDLDAFRLRLLLPRPLDAIFFSLDVNKKQIVRE